MNRVATGPVQTTMMNGMQRIQGQLADALNQQATQKKAADYGALGIDTSRLLSARSMMARQDAQNTVGSQVSSTLEFYNTGLTNIDTSAENLRKALLEVIGTGDGPGIQATIEDTFKDLRGTLNTAIAGQPIFAGSQTDRNPFVPQQLSDLVGLNPADAFTNDQIKSSAQLADGVNMEFGIVASDVGTNLVQAFKTLAEAGPFGDTPTQAQLDAMQTAIGQLETGLSDVRTASANNGRKQSQVDTLMTRGEDRQVMLQKVVGDAEDADMAEVATNIINIQTIMSASYTVFSRLSQMSLTNYL
jgi:flagellar hook-associated protein 3 FlgL